MKNKTIFLDLLYSQCLAKCVKNTPSRMSNSSLLQQTLQPLNSSLIIDAIPPSIATKSTLPILDSIQISPEKPTTTNNKKIPTLINKFNSQVKQLLQNTFFQNDSKKHYSFTIDVQNTDSFSSTAHQLFNSIFTTTQTKSYQLTLHKLTHSKTILEFNNQLNTIKQPSALQAYISELAVTWLTLTKINNSQLSTLPTKLLNALSSISTTLTTLKTTLNFLTAEETLQKLTNLTEEITSYTNKLQESYNQNLITNISEVTTHLNFINSLLKLLPYLAAVTTTTHFFKLHLLNTLNNSKKPYLKSNISNTVVNYRLQTISSLCFNDKLFLNAHNAILTLCQSIETLNIVSSSQVKAVKTTSQLNQTLLTPLFQPKAVLSWYWERYFHTCFASNLTELGISIIEDTFDKLAYEELLPHIVESMQSYLKELSSHTTKLPKALQDQTHPSYKITLAELNQLISSSHKLQSQLQWVYFIGTYLSSQGRYSFFSELCCQLLKHNQSHFAVHVLRFLSIILQSHIFYSHLGYIIQLFPTTSLTLFEKTIELQHVMSQNNQTDNWHNSLFYLNKWKNHCQVTIFNLSLDYWQQLFEIIDLKYIQNSTIIKNWINNSSPLSIERKCLNQYIHYLSKSNSNNKKLLTLFLQCSEETQQTKLFKKTKLNYDSIIQLLEKKASFTQNLNQLHHTGKLPALAESIRQYINTLEDIQVNYSTFCITKILENSLSSIEYIMSTCIHYQLDPSLTLFNYLNHLSMHNSKFNNLLINSCYHCLKDSETKKDYINFLKTLLNSSTSNKLLFNLISKLKNESLTPQQSQTSIKDISELNEDMSVLIKTYLQTIQVAQEDPNQIDLFLPQHSKNIQDWFNNNLTHLMDHFPADLAKKIESLLIQAKNSNISSFSTTRKKIITTIYTSKELSLHQQISLAHATNLITLIIKEDNQTDHHFILKSLLTLSNSIIYDPVLIKVTLSNFYIHLHDKNAYQHIKESISIIETLFISATSQNINDFETKAEIISLLLKLTTQLIDHCIISNQHLLNHILHLETNIFDWISSMDPLFINDGAFQKHCLEPLLDLLSHGYIHQKNDCFETLKTTFSYLDYPNEIHIRLIEIIDNYQDFFNHIENPHLPSVAKLATTIENAYFQQTLSLLFTTNPGICLAYTFHFLNHYDSNAKSKPSYLNTKIISQLFNLNFEPEKWITTSCFYPLLKEFYKRQNQHEPFNITHVSFNSLDLYLFCFWFSKAPKQLSNFLESLIHKAQKNNPYLKKYFLNIFDATIQSLLSNEHTTLTNLKNNCLQEIIYLKESLENNISVALTELEQFTSAITISTLSSEQLQTTKKHIQHYIISLEKQLNIDTPQATPLYRHELSLLSTIETLNNIKKVKKNIDPTTISTIISKLCDLYVYDTLGALSAPPENSTNQINQVFINNEHDLFIAFQNYFMQRPFIQTLTIENLCIILNQQSQEKTTEWIYKLNVLDSISKDNLVPILISLIQAISIKNVIELLFKASSHEDIIKTCADQYPPLLMSIQTNLVSEQQLDKLQQILKNITSIHSHPIFSYINHPYSPQHQYHDFFEAVLSKNINTIHQIIQYFFENNEPNILLLLEYIFLHNHKMFKTICTINDSSLAETIINHLSQNPSQPYNTFSLITQSKWRTLPSIELELTNLSLSKELIPNHPMSLNFALETNYNTTSFLSESLLIEWISTLRHSTPYNAVFSFLEQHISLIASCFNSLYFENSSEHYHKLPATFFLDFLHYTTEKNKHIIISTLEEKYLVSKKQFSFLLLEEVSKDQYSHKYLNLIMSCLSYMNLLHSQLESSQFNPIAVQCVSISILSFSNNLNLEDIISLLKKAEYLPVSTHPNNINTLSNALLDEKESHLIIDLSINYPLLCKQLLQNKIFANKLQQMIYFNHLETTHLLYKKILECILKFSYIESLNFLLIYTSSFLSSHKRQECKALIDTFLPYNKESTEKNNTSLKEKFFDLINTPILRIPQQDIILSPLFENLPNLQKKLDPPQHLLFQLSPANTSTTISQIELNFIKKECEQCCQHAESRFCLLTYLFQAQEEQAIQLFCNIIQNWEEKDSLYDILLLHTTKHSEQQLLHDYIYYITGIICKTSIDTLSHHMIESVANATHFLLACSSQENYLINWAEASLSVKVKSQNAPTFIPIFKSIHINTETLFKFCSPFIKSKKIYWQSIILKSLQNTDCFINLMQHYIQHTKDHIILSEIISESGTLHHILYSKLKHFFKHDNENLFRICSTFYLYNIQIDHIFNKVYTYYLKPTFINNISISKSFNNPFIATTIKSFQQQELPFLFYFSKCINNFVIKNNYNISWVIQAIQSLYTITPFQQNNYQLSSELIQLKKDFITNGIANDNGDLLVNIDDISWELFKKNIPSTKITTELETTFNNMKQQLLTAHIQKTNILNMLLDHAPNLFINSSPKIMTSDNMKTQYIFKESLCFLDYLLTTLLLSNKPSLAFQDVITRLFQHPKLKKAFYNYIKQLPKETILFILTHKNLTIIQRHVILHALLSNEQQFHNDSNCLEWKSIVANSIMEELEKSWTLTPTSGHIKSETEILLFFFIHYPESFHNLFNSKYTLIYEKTGLSFASLFHCKSVLNHELLSNSAAIISQSEFNHTIHSLIGYGFSIFECCIAFKASDFYSAELEKEWITSIFESEINDSKSSILTIHQHLLSFVWKPKKSIYIPNETFEKTSLLIAFQKWLQQKNHLNAFNLLNIKSYQDFTKTYDIKDVFTECLNEAKAINPTLNIKESNIESKAKSFFLLFFNTHATSQRQPLINVTQITILAHLFNLNISHYSLNAFTSSIKTLIHNIDSNEITKIISNENNSLLHILSDRLPYFFDHLKSYIKQTTSLPINFSHTSFKEISPKELLRFKTILREKNILDTSNKITPQRYNDISKKNSLRKSFPLETQHLQKYISSQHYLLESAINIKIKIDNLALNTTGCKIKFLEQCFPLQEHEWAYINFLLPQQINGLTIETIIQAALETTQPITKQLLQDHAKKIKYKTNKNHKVQTIFNHFKHSEISSVDTPLPSTSYHLTNLMLQLSEIN